jgi:hypothetical protein
MVLLYWVLSSLYLYIIIKYIRVPWFGSSVERFENKSSIISVNKTAVPFFSQPFLAKSSSLVPTETQTRLFQCLLSTAVVIGSSTSRSPPNPPWLSRTSTGHVRLLLRRTPLSSCIAHVSELQVDAPLTRIMTVFELPIHDQACLWVWPPLPPAPCFPA